MRPSQEATMSKFPIFSSTSHREFFARCVACAFGLSVVALVGACARDTTAPQSAITAVPDAAVQSDRQNGDDAGSARRYLIADQFNNRVIEVDRAGNILWHFGRGPNDISAASIIGVNDAQRVGDLTLMAGTGAPPGTEPKCPTGCADNRVILVDPSGDETVEASDRDVQPGAVDAHCACEAFDGIGLRHAARNRLSRRQISE